MPRLPAALLLIALAAGCGGSSVPQGNPISVRFEVVQPELPYANLHGRYPQPLTVHHTDAVWVRLRRQLPDPLPEPVDQGSECGSGQMVSVRVAWDLGASSAEIDYGPCRWPDAMEPVRLFMLTLLQRRFAAERRCECP